ncbi:MAG: four helix bundle protein [Epsilonproteobacteria bacterium]|nr:four helix bundle protein [Campylobacterota bacterium]
MGDYKELNVWKEAIDLVENIYKFIKTFPKYVLSDPNSQYSLNIPIDPLWDLYYNVEIMTYRRKHLCNA